MQQRKHSARLTAALIATLLGSFAAAQAAPQRSEASDQVSVPGETIVRLELSDRVSSRTAAQGDRVKARLDANDRSGFPAGTEFEGVITEIERVSQNRPGMLDMEFRRVILPGGSSEQITGDLASLASENIRAATDGRLTVRRPNVRSDWKWVGASSGPALADASAAAAPKGDLLGTLFNVLTRDRGRGFQEVDLERGAKFGLRLDRTVAFYTRPDNRFVNDTQPTREPATRERVAGYRRQTRFETSDVYVDGTRVLFTDLKPTRVNGTLYVPLRPIAEAGKWDLRQTRRSNEFSLSLPDREVRAIAGERSLTRGSERFDLEVAPMLIGGEVYVPMDYLTRAANLRADWNRQERRLDLTSGRQDRERVASLEGEVLSVDEELGIVTVMGPGEQRYRVQADEATLWLRGRRVDLQDLRAGDRVTVDGWARTR